MTIFLAQLWGPILLSLGLGMLISRGYYRRMYQDLEKEVLAVIVLGTALMVLGILQIKAHNAWGSFPEKLISILGWGLLLKGLVFTILPSFVDRKGNLIAGSNLIWIVNIVLLAVGGYLSWFAYFL